MADAPPVASLSEASDRTPIPETAKEKFERKEAERVLIKKLRTGGSLQRRFEKERVDKVQAEDTLTHRGQSTGKPAVLSRPGPPVSSDYLPGDTTRCQDIYTPEQTLQGNQKEVQLENEKIPNLIRLLFDQKQATELAAYKTQRDSEELQEQHKAATATAMRQFLMGQRDTNQQKQQQAEVQQFELYQQQFSSSRQCVGTSLELNPARSPSSQSFQSQHYPSYAYSETTQGLAGSQHRYPHPPSNAQHNPHELHTGRQGPNGPRQNKQPTPSEPTGFSRQHGRYKPLHELSSQHDNTYSDQDSRHEHHAAPFHRQGPSAQQHVHYHQQQMMFDQQQAAFRQQGVRSSEKQILYSHQQMMYVQQPTFNSQQQMQYSQQQQMQYSQQQQMQYNQPRAPFGQQPEFAYQEPPREFFSDHQLAEQQRMRDRHSKQNEQKPDF